MKNPDPLIYLEHILDCIKKIKSYTREMDYDDFFSNELVKDGVVRNIEIIGEATKNLPSDFKNKHKELPWKDMAGMRDRIAHFYFGIEYKFVWDVVTEDAPKLEKSIKEIVKSLKGK